jgi:hypothetical protein
MRRIALALAALLAFGWAEARADEGCPLPGQKPMLVVQLFFGQSEKGKGEIPHKAWNAFLRDAVTPRFPDGFTVYDGYGQWRDPATSKIVRERAKVVEIAAESAPELGRKIPELIALYRAKFHQQSVGVVTSEGCGQF